MDTLESFINENELSKENILKLVDDYSIVSHYIGQELELHEKYSSPLREGDNDPSFSLFYGYGDLAPNKLYFKDHASIGCGDVFDFVSILFKKGNQHLSYNETLKQIDYDFQLGLSSGEQTTFKPNIYKKIPIKKERKRIGIIKQPFTKEFQEYWWLKYELGKSIIDLYQVDNPSTILYIGKYDRKVITPKTLCISYDIGYTYKIYQPNEKDNKFRNNFPANYVEGWLQIDWTRNDKVIITKAMKECMLFRGHWNLQAVSGKSENTMVPPHLMAVLQSHFKEVFIWLDPDKAGLESTQKYMQMYPWLKPLTMPKGIAEKDPTDFFEVHRKNVTTDLLTYFKNTIMANNNDFFDKAYESLAKMQKEKDIRYGNSALKPLDIFAKHHPYGSRLDEKLARVKNSDTLRKNDIADIIGGCMLLCRDKGWDNFEDLID